MVLGQELERRLLADFQVHQVHRHHLLHLTYCLVLDRLQLLQEVQKDHLIREQVLVLELIMLRPIRLLADQDQALQLALEVVEVEEEVQELQLPLLVEALPNPQL
jgi:hypothetical protein